MNIRAARLFSVPGALWLALLLAPATAHAQAPGDPAQTVTEIYEQTLDAIPDQDLSWIALRSVVGPELWDESARLLPDAMLEVTLPGVTTGRVDLSDLPNLDLDVVPDTDATTSLSIADVLGGITWVITMAGTVLLGVFAVLHIVSAVGAYGTGSTFSLAGWGAARLLGSVGLLMPVGEQGYCVAQAAVVAAAQLGIGMANFAWDLAAEPLVSIARSESAAEVAAREVLAIDAEETAAAAVATGMCVGLTSRSLSPTANAAAWARDGRLHSRRCGGIEDSSASAERLAGLARAYGAAGARLEEEIGRIHGERVAVLSELRASVSDAMVDPGSFFFGATPQAEPLLAWVQQAAPPALRLDGVEVHMVGHDLVKGYRTPAETQSAWWLLASLIGERETGACLREWTGTDSAGEPVWRQLRTALRFGGLGTYPELRPHPRDRWPFQWLSAGLSGAAGTQCAPNRYSPYWRAVNGLHEGNEAAATEALAPLIQDLYGAQLRPLIGDVEGGGTGEGRRGWMMAGAVYWHLQQARGVNGILRELATPEVVPPDSDSGACGEDGGDCPNLHAWQAGRMIGLAAAHSARPGRPALVYAGLPSENAGAPADLEAGPALARWMVGELRAAATDSAPLTRMMNTGQDLVRWGLTLAVPGKLVSLVPGPWGSVGDKILAVGVILLVAGLALAVWIPCLPLLAWLASVWAWLVSVVMGLMAAPLWALAHAIPDGQGLMSHYSRNGYQLLLFTAARPVFLIAGLLLAMLLAGLICKIAAVLFAAAMGGYSAAVLTEGAGPGLHWFLVVSASLVFFIFIVWMVAKTFTLCHELPDRVFEWVGGGNRSLGDNEMLDHGRAFVAGLVVMGRQALPRPRPPAPKPGSDKGAGKGKSASAGRPRQKKSGPRKPGSGWVPFPASGGKK